MERPAKLTILTLCALACLVCLDSVQSRPATRRQANDLPSLSETLAVAKSPYEPVTLVPPGLPGARNDETPVKEVSLDSAAVEHKQSTRAAQSVEQERDATKEVSDSSDLSGSSTESIDNTTPIDNTETDSITTTNEPDTLLDTSTTTTTTTKPEPFVTTESLATKEITTTTLEPARSSESTETTESPSTTTTTPASSTVQTEAPSSSSRVGDDSADKTVSTDSTSESESTTTASSDNSSATTDQNQSTTPTTTPTPTTTTTASSTTSITSTELPETTLKPASSTPAPVEASEPEEPLVSVEPSSTTTEQPSSSSTAANKPAEEVKDEANKGAACNHLPSYDSEEIQKVFREETTYRNGTIRGKFTYINFDQRYRLVHYTRLPYGPVKIDQVEELGQIAQNVSRSGSSNGGSEVPDSVLQLRNILPNSLFGFPFLGPMNANKPIEPKETGLPESATANDNKNTDTDRSNKYFYSTDSISTPNLLSPSVPVSLLQGQRRVSQSLSNADTLGPSYYDNLPVGNMEQHSIGTEARKFKLRPTDNAPTIIETPNEQIRYPISGGSNPSPFQFQYASAPQAGGQAQPRQSGLIYTYSTQPQSQYQYSPLPVYSFQQPAYYSTARQQLVSPMARYPINELIQRQDQQQEISSHPNHHQTHQPHSHEHYMAQFMFAQPPTEGGHRQMNDESLPEEIRPRLKLKTSKSLNHRQDFASSKSAQLRASPPLISSPVRVHRLQHRQRAGKQNHDLKPAYNSSPIVYHVRSPVGQLYTIPQYSNPSHSMAYDRDD